MNKRIMTNSLWMMSEKIVAIFGLIFVTSFVAKYVGPGVFGSIALAMSIFQLIQLVAQLGTDVLIFKRLSRNRQSGVNLINVTVPIRTIVYMVLSLPVLFFYIYKADHSALYYLVAAFVACFIQSVDVYSIYYDATLNSKINTYVNVIGLVFSLLIRWLIAFLKLDPLWLCFPIILAPLIPCLIRYFYYINNTHKKSISSKFKRKYVKYIIGAGSAFVISSLSVAIYTRLSLLMLGFFDGESAVGIYSVAATLATSWSFVLNSLVTSSLPSIFSENDDEKALTKAAKLNLIVIGVSMPIIFSVYFVGEWFIKTFYGDLYMSSYHPLLILTFSTLLGSLGTVSARIIAKYSGYSFLSKKMFLVAIFSFIVNFGLIMQFNIIGAAVANVLTQFFSLTIFNYPFKKGVVFKLHLKTIFFRVKG
ncbi:oligosaccharide flippase family protein [Raoultella ornithinolytica]|uniref:oligosaccharide flippase family protein n=1 Tax=Raoultella ornithinolytica TaxID=54291 RepID=UPI003D962E28